LIINPIEKILIEIYGAKKAKLDHPTSFTYMPLTCTSYYISWM